MSSVTQRIKSIKQPYGGYIRASQFKAISEDDGLNLNENENVHACVVGLAVDYLTRFISGAKKEDAFEFSLLGAKIAEMNGMKNYYRIALNLLSGIDGLNEKSIINACKIVTFDVWYRNVSCAILAKEYYDTDPDKATIQNIQVLVSRGLSFLKKYGPITQSGFTFFPENPDKAVFKATIESGRSYGGYTSTVSAGDGDFLTADTIWDFKVSKSKPSKNHTLQLLMYWIMGQHSGQKIFNGITKLGIFNPRLNSVYLLDVNTISEEIIKTVENEVICY